MRNFTNFADLARHIADGRATDAQVQSYDGSFLDYSDMAKLSTTDAPERLEMPDPDQVRAAVEMMMATLFDVFRDTRMEPFATDLAWGFVNSFHVVAKRVEGREDDAAKKLGELARHYDPSEIYATEVEDAQTLCQTLQGCREALECMRDHAGEVYRVEVGKPFSPVKGSRVSSGLTASMIDARDYLASRSRTRREQYEPQGPVVGRPAVGGCRSPLLRSRQHQGPNSGNDPRHHRTVQRLRCHRPCLGRLARGQGHSVPPRPKPWQPRRVRAQ